MVANKNYFVMVWEIVIIVIIERCDLFIIGTLALDFNFPRFGKGVINKWGCFIIFSFF